MKRVYETQFDVGDTVRWDFFGMPEGFEKKSGEGKIVGIYIHQYRKSHQIRYDIESGPRIIQEVPEQCVMRHAPCGAV